MLLLTEKIINKIMSAIIFISLLNLLSEYERTNGTERNSI